MTAHRRSPTPTRTVLAFIHIPKCAGTTVNSILAQNYRKSEIARFKCRRMNDLTPDQKRLLDTGLPGVKLIRGHMVYGVHQYVAQEITYFTLLRHPVDRVISNYYYAKALPDHQLNRRITEDNLSLLEFATRGLSPGLDNGQVRYLSGFGNPRDGHKNRPPCPPEMLSIAEQNLKSFALAGIVEQFDPFILLAGKRFGWTRLNYRRRNVRADRPKLRDIATDVRDAIAAQNPLDMQLYENARLRFEQLLAEEKDWLEAQIPAYRAQNERLAKVSAWTDRLTSLFNRTPKA